MSKLSQENGGEGMSSKRESIIEIPGQPVRHDQNERQKKTESLPRSRQSVWFGNSFGPLGKYGKLRRAQFVMAAKNLEVHIMRLHTEICRLLFKTISVRVYRMPILLYQWLCKCTAIKTIFLAKPGSFKLWKNTFKRAESTSENKSAFVCDISKSRTSIEWSQLLVQSVRS